MRRRRTQERTGSKSYACYSLQQLYSESPVALRYEHIFLLGRDVFTRFYFVARRWPRSTPRPPPDAREGNYNSQQPARQKLERFHSPLSGGGALAPLSGSSPLVKRERAVPPVRRPPARSVGGALRAARERRRRAGMERCDLGERRRGRIWTRRAGAAAPRG